MLHNFEGLDKNPVVTLQFRQDSSSLGAMMKIVFKDGSEIELEGIRGVRVKDGKMEFVTSPDAFAFKV